MNVLTKLEGIFSPIPIPLLCVSFFFQNICLGEFFNFGIRIISPAILYIAKTAHMRTLKIVMQPCAQSYQECSVLMFHECEQMHWQCRDGGWHGETGVVNTPGRLPQKENLGTTVSAIQVGKRFS